MSSCTNKIATISTTLKSPTIGTQAEVYFGSNQNEAKTMALQNKEVQFQNNTVGVRENLVFMNFFKNVP